MIIMGVITILYSCTNLFIWVVMFLASIGGMSVYDSAVSWIYYSISYAGFSQIMSALSVTSFIMGIIFLLHLLAGIMMIVKQRWPYILLTVFYSIAIAFFFIMTIISLISQNSTMIIISLSYIVFYIVMIVMYAVTQKCLTQNVQMLRYQQKQHTYNA